LTIKIDSEDDTVNLASRQSVQVDNKPTKPKKELDKVGLRSVLQQVEDVHDEPDDDFLEKSSSEEEVYVKPQRDSFTLTSFKTIA